MVGGGNRRDEGSFTVSNTNVFAALETLRKKKKSDKEKGSSKGSKSSSKAAGKSKETEEKQVYWAPAPLTVKSWADVDDEDDDDYYATTAPPQAVWGGSGLSKAEDTQKSEPVEESGSEDDLLDEGDDDLEDDVDHETEVQEQPETVVIKPVEASPAPKETDRQLSKKEKRKKELAELEAILADFGVNPKEKSENEPSGVNKNSKENGDADKKDGAPAESKSAKKKKKKDKASKESKEPQHQPNSSDAPNEQDENVGNDQAEEDSLSGIDVKGRLKKMASSKKKKSSKEMDAAARAAALEAAARSAKLASAKKKEKNHYNQQPVR